MYKLYSICHPSHLKFFLRNLEICRVICGNPSQSNDRGFDKVLPGQVPLTSWVGGNDEQWWKLVESSPPQCRNFGPPITDLMSAEFEPEVSL
jgi:hypothetical protein